MLVHHAHRHAVLEVRVRVIFRVRRRNREIVLEVIRVIEQRLALWVVGRKIVHRAHETVVAPRLKCIQRNRLKACRLAERRVGVIRAQLRPMVVGAEEDVFVRMRA